MNKVCWGIIGCGNVTEMKSGPAFNKVPGSYLGAVMRRDLSKAKDYAERHGVKNFYNDATQLINDPEINAIYIATPPLGHEEYAIAAILAGKAVYVEKPMAIDLPASIRITNAANKHKVKLSVAHYRREQPLFKKVKQLLQEGAIGKVRLMEVCYFKSSLTPDALSIPGFNWRMEPAISGGGLFHDLAPHQLDLACYFFGAPAHIYGYSSRQEKIYNVDDIVTGSMVFNSGEHFSGTWVFNVAPGLEEDRCRIIGSEGEIKFSVFDYNEVHLTNKDGVLKFPFTPPLHVQQPMIARVVQYFLGNAANPCSGEDGNRVMHIIKEMTQPAV